MADWEEIRKLAADFQRAQSSGPTQKLSEKNCIEVITKLQQLKLLEVYFTVDGKEYVTPKQLCKEIRDEVYIQGRINIVNLAKTLNIDLSCIESRVPEIVKMDPKVHFVLGQFVHDCYLDRISEEINEKLQQEGHLLITDLVKLYDFPLDFVQQMLNSRLNLIVQGRVDSSSNIIFTEAHLSRSQAHILGSLSAVTRPISCAYLINLYHFQERIFFNIVDELISSGKLAGSLVGGRQSVKAVYVPELYSRAQSEWVLHNLLQNGCVEYSALGKLGVSDPEAFIKRLNPGKDIVYLSWCCLGSSLLVQVEACIEEVANEASFTPKDVENVIKHVLLHMQVGAQVDLYQHSIVVNKSVLAEIFKRLENGMQERAMKVAQHNQLYSSQSHGKAQKPQKVVEKSKTDKKEERRRRAITGHQGGHQGGNTKGRESKTKSTKKKTSHEIQDTEEELVNENVPSLFTYMSVDELHAFLKEETDLCDAPENVLHDVSHTMWPSLCATYQIVAREAAEAALSASVEKRRQQHYQLQERLNTQVAMLHLYKKGIEQFESDQQQKELTLYLLRNVGADLVGLILLHLSEAEALALPNSELDPGLQSDLLKMLKCTCLEEFFPLLNLFLEKPECDLMLKKMDQRRNKEILQDHVRGLQEQLEHSHEGPNILLLSCLLLFQFYTGFMLCASGKFVTNILHLLNSFIPEDVYQLLEDCRGDPNSHSVSEEQLLRLSSRVRTTVINLVKSGDTEKADSQR